MAMLLRSMFIILLIFTFASPIYSQGIFLEKGESGIILSGYYSSFDDASGLGASIGYTIRGVVDVGIDIDRFVLDVATDNGAEYILHRNDDDVVSIINSITSGFISSNTTATTTISLLVTNFSIYGLRLLAFA